jgi:3'-5' exoribonuclease
LENLVKNQYVKNLQEGDAVNDVFVATRNDLRTKQDGGKFLGMVFKDRTGEIGGIMWNNAAEVSRMFQVGDVVNVKGKVNSYQGRLQLQVERVLPLRDGEYDVSDMVYAPESAEEDLAYLRKILGAIENTWLKQVAESFLNDADFMMRFSSAAAAKKWHHEYRGGLLRHTHEMCRLGETMCELYPNIDRDILMTSIFLHDVGKLDEMTHDLCVEYTTVGRLLGHVHLGAEMVNAKISKIEGFPEKLRLELLHCILSHHGELQYGSPVVPKSLEAIVLHHIDNLDAQAAAFSRIVQGSQDKGQEWSEYMPLIDRMIWNKEG